MPKIDLTRDQIQNLLNMVEQASFRGSNAEKVVELKNILKAGINPPKQEPELTE